MIKRIKSTKIGDVFEVKISETEKRYMQYVVSDMTNLNSDVIRAFKKKYSISEKPNINEIVNEEVMFYAHCDSRNGIRQGYWTLYGNTENVGNINDIFFKTTTDHGDVVSHNWYIWQVNQKHQFIGELTGDLKNINVGLVFPAVDILYMIINNGSFEGVYPRCE
jgi:hypothetical protein